MTKKSRDVTPKLVNQAIAFIDEVLVEIGFMFPSRGKHVTDDDLSLYGLGAPKSIEELQRSELAFQKRTSRPVAGPADVVKSLAMAARNGEQISDTVWARMKKDREHAEQETKSYA